MYFHSRLEAGQKLAAELTQYANMPCVVVALSTGAVAVGEQIAAALGCKLTMLLSEDVSLPGEHMTLGTVGQDGSFVYNNMFSAGEIEEYYAEFHGYIDDQKREKFADINRLLGAEGLFDAKMLKDHIVILVSDGLKSGISLTAAEQFLKPIRIKRLIIATPIASVQAVDRMHIIADELHCLAATENYIKTSHYYDLNDTPSKEDIITKLKSLPQ
jgi:predicted phosphoribosyltransferase